MALVLSSVATMSAYLIAMPRQNVVVSFEYDATCL